MKSRRPSRRPVAVIFDMDGLMLDTESLGPQTWRDAAAMTGVEFDLRLLPDMIGRNYRDTRVFLRQHYGPSYPVEQLTNACLAAFDAIVAREGIAQKRGLCELLDWLEREDVPRAVATSTRRDRAEAQLGQQGLLHRFAVLSAETRSNSANRPRTYSCRGGALAVARRLRGARGFRTGRARALTAGMMPIMVPDLHARPRFAGTRAASAAVAGRGPRIPGRAPALSLPDAARRAPGGNWGGVP
jgi:beta-phosphoglucomutase-like phosphatase (HAD superfamily)